MNGRDGIMTWYANETMRFDARTEKVESIETGLQQFALSWDDVLHEPRTVGSIAFERSMPGSLCVNAFASNSTFVFSGKPPMSPLREQGARAKELDSRLRGNDR
jgi:hypothetical protein